MGCLPAKVDFQYDSFDHSVVGEFSFYVVFFDFKGYVFNDQLVASVWVIGWRVGRVFALALDACQVWNFFVVKDPTGFDFVLIVSKVDFDV